MKLSDSEADNELVDIAFKHVSSLLLVDVSDERHRVLLVSHRMCSLLLWTTKIWCEDKWNVSNSIHHTTPSPSR